MNPESTGPRVRAVSMEGTVSVERAVLQVSTDDIGRAARNESTALPECHWTFLALGYVIVSVSIVFWMIFFTLLLLKWFLR